MTVSQMSHCQTRSNEIGLTTKRKWPTAQYCQLKMLSETVIKTRTHIWLP